jgi:hypothetical protein
LKDKSPTEDEPMKKFFGTLEVIAWRGVVEASRLLGCDVFAKVKFSDLLEVRSSGINDEDFRYAICAHFDVLVVRNNLILFAIEIDASSSDDIQKQNMERKQRLCREFNFPLLYIDAAKIDKALLAHHIRKEILLWSRSQNLLSELGANV